MQSGESIFMENNKASVIPFLCDITSIKIFPQYSQSYCDQLNIFDLWCVKVTYMRNTFIYLKIHSIAVGGM